MFLAELASELLLFTATPPYAGARTLTRTHFLDSAFSPERSLGCNPAHLAGGLSLLAFSRARAHTRARGLPWCVSQWRTSSLCHLRPGSPVRHPPDTVRCSRLERGALSDTKSAFVTPAALSPLPELAHVDTPHTECPLLHAWSFPSTQATKYAWEHHSARP